MGGHNKPFPSLAQKLQNLFEHFGPEAENLSLSHVFDTDTHKHSKAIPPPPLRRLACMGVYGTADVCAVPCTCEYMCEGGGKLAERGAAHDRTGPA